MLGQNQHNEINQGWTSSLLLSFGMSGTGGVGKTWLGNTRSCVQSIPQTFIGLTVWKVLSGFSEGVRYKDGISISWRFSSGGGKWCDVSPNKYRAQGMKHHVSDKTTGLGDFLGARWCWAGTTGEGFMREGDFRVGTENQEDFFFKQVAIVKRQRSNGSGQLTWRMEGQRGGMSNLCGENGGCAHMRAWGWGEEGSTAEQRMKLDCVPTRKRQRCGLSSKEELPGSKEH